ncbi:hypothetical protein Sjap_017004 [Stephania japonica]|uniref:Uncharacterized protein n=1 Tax=Stephania japonica TaxID=461633 RepID=A0AAP0I5C4_9MAGN
MGRGKIEIKRIENSTNRQVTYSKRRAGIVKKARELTVLCDAEVSLIVFSSTGKLSEFVSPSTTTKKVFDQYQQISGINLWNSHYERMQENLNKLKEINYRLRREISHRVGQYLDDMNFEELRHLEHDLESSIRLIRDRKLRNLQETHTNLLREFETRRAEDPYYNEAEYESLVSMGNIGADIYSFRLQAGQANLPNGGDFGLYNLRLA